MIEQSWIDYVFTTEKKFNALTAYFSETSSNANPKTSKLIESKVDLINNMHPKRNLG